MFNAIAFCIVLLDGWGMIGIWTNKFGFHNAWEFWVRHPSISKYRHGTNPAYRCIKHSTVSSSAPGIATRKS